MERERRCRLRTGPWMRPVQPRCGNRKRDKTHQENKHLSPIPQMANIYFWSHWAESEGLLFLILLLVCVLIKAGLPGPSMALVEMLTFEMEPVHELITEKRRGWSETGSEVNDAFRIMKSGTIEAYSRRNKPLERTASFSNQQLKLTVNLFFQHSRWLSWVCLQGLMSQNPPATKCPTTDGNRVTVKALKTLQTMLLCFILIGFY